MEYARHFKFLVCARNFDETDLEGARLRDILNEVERLGYSTIRARRDDDAELVVSTDSAIGCVVVDWGRKGLQGRSAALISLVRKRGLDVPIVVLVRHHRLEDIARNLVSQLRQYADSLRTPFFGALVDYAEQGNMLWTCPGH